MRQLVYGMTLIALASTLAVVAAAVIVGNTMHMSTCVDFAVPCRADSRIFIPPSL